MEKVVPGVHQFSVGANAFLIDGDDGVVLIDAGVPKRHQVILDGLRSIGRSPSEVIAILVTHGHTDHFGSARTLRDETSAPVIASVGDAPYLRGEQPPPPPPIFDVPILNLVTHLIPSAQPMTVDHAVTSGPVPIASDISAIATPGHTRGHISFLLDRHGGVLFAGDSAMATRSGGVTRGFMNRKSASFDSSIRTMADLEFDVACFGHSRAIASQADSAFRDLAASI